MSIDNELRGLLAGDEIPWPVQRALILLRDEFTCAICGGYATQADHIWPRCYGGSDHPLNLQALCSSCNQRKGRSVLFALDDGVNLRDFSHLTLEQVRHYRDEAEAQRDRLSSEIRVYRDRINDLHDGKTVPGEPIDLERHGLCPTCSVPDKAFVMHADACPLEPGGVSSAPHGGMVATRATSPGSAGAR